jgi:hypothetical protein
MMRASGNHVAAALLRAISACGSESSADRQKPTMIVEEIVSTDWASATFVGATHAFTLRFEGDGASIAEAFRTFKDLPEREIAIPGHIVAELVASPGPTQHMDDNMIARNLTVNVLTIID